jgi:hypothetical protein
VAALARAGDSRAALARLRDAMRSHRWSAGARRLDLAQAVAALDRRTRAEGFHALHDWDGVAAAVNPETIPVDVLDLAIRTRGGTDPPEPGALGILVDYYFMYLLALLSLRVWDEGHPDANLDLIARALDLLQGPGGSGQRFADDAETLMLLATSHYEPDEQGFASLLDRVRTLGGAPQARIASAHAVSMGCHLRFGFEATYARDLGSMRDDNAADYPWLSYSLLTLLRTYDERDHAGVAPDGLRRLEEALVNGLSADPAGFVGPAPARMLVADTERREIRDRFEARRAQLAERFDAFLPTAQAYSPLSFFFNFCQNVLKGAVIDAVLWGAPSAVSVNDLLSGLPSDGRPQLDQERQALARTLMGYARSNPHRIRGRLMPVIVYDPQAGRRAFAATRRAVRAVP